MIREELPLGGGVYGLWAPDRSDVYVGTTNDLRRRCNEHLPAIMLGCDFEAVLFLPDASRKERMSWEDRAIIALRAHGVRVVNNTSAEHSEKMRVACAPIRSEVVRASWASLTPAQRTQRVCGASTAAERSARHKNSWARLTPEQRRERVRRKDA